MREKLCSDDTKKTYDIDLLLEETDAIKKEFDDFIASSGGNDSFQVIFDAIGEFFMTPPFEGLDSIEYGVNEVCVFSILEYFVGKEPEEHDHDTVRKEYRDSIADRTYEEVGDHWIGVYDDLQKRYDKLWSAFDGERAFEYKLAACSIVAIS
ncbi:MAG: hypothetical protein IJA38_07860, partial [Bacteroidales bacterium]|nr:hypothetical protein [Bacteroidales bacterium]